MRGTLQQGQGFIQAASFAASRVRFLDHGKAGVGGPKAAGARWRPSRETPEIGEHGALEP